MLVVHKPENNIYLPPELCFIPNLPEDFTKNSMAMRDIQDYKSFNPTDRFKRIQTMGEKLRAFPELQDAGINMEQNMIQVKGRYLEDL